jgi:hydroxyacylglutathione hydrolase
VNARTGRPLEDGSSEEGSKAGTPRIKLITRPAGPLLTNVHILGDEETREALVIDAARPSVRWIALMLEEQGWRLRLIVSTHGHWDHVGDNAELQAWARTQPAIGGRDEAGEAAGSAPIAVHPLDRERLTNPKPLHAPFVIEPSIPTVDLADADVIALGSIRLRVIHTPGHTPGSVCLLEESQRILFSGDTLFNGNWGNTNLPGGSEEAMVESLTRLAGLPDEITVRPGHGARTMIGWERPLLERIAREGRLPA